MRQINYFNVPENWLTKRIAGLISDIDNILSVDKTGSTDKEKIKSSRYLPTLKNIPMQHREELNEWLTKYKSWLNSKACASVESPRWSSTRTSATFAVVGFTYVAESRQNDSESHSEQLEFRETKFK